MPIDPKSSALFMDDAALWETAKSRESLEKNMQNKLDTLNSWCKGSHIVINASKTVAMVNDLNNEITLDLGDEQIYSVDKTKYLGVDLESRAGYMEQLYVGAQNLTKKLQSTMQQLMPLKNRVPQHVRYNVGRSLLMSKLMYHHPVMGAEEETGVYDTLQKQVNRYLRWLSHAPHSTPIELLQSQTAIPPIRILLQESVISNLARTMCNPNEVFEISYWKWNGDGENTSPFNIYTQLRQLLPVEEGAEIGGRSRLSHRQMTKLQGLTIHAAADIKEALQQHQHKQLVRTDYDFALWTDGSMKTDEQGKARASGGWIYTDGEESYTGSTKVTPALSSFHAECAAMTKGVEDMMNNPDIELDGKAIGIFTDSRGLCSHLEKLLCEDISVETHTHFLTTSLAKLIDRGKSVDITWIPGHQGIGLNEEADQQADHGYESQSTFSFPFTRKWIRSTLLHHTKRYFCDHLKSHVKNSELNPNYPDRSHFKTPRNKTSDTRRLGGEQLFHLQTGHTFLKDHQVKVNNNVKDNVCTWCKSSPETIEHILLECPELQVQPQRDAVKDLLGDMTLPELISLNETEPNEALLSLLNKLCKRKVWI